MGTPVGAEVRIDGELAGKLPLPHPVKATVGGVAMEVRAPGYLPIVRSATVAVTVTGASVRTSTDSTTGRTRLLPVGISEARLDLGPAPAPGAAATAVTLTCGAGAAVVVDGRAVALHGPPCAASRSWPGRAAATL